MLIDPDRHLAPPHYWIRHHGNSQSDVLSYASFYTHLFCPSCFFLSPICSAGVVVPVSLKDLGVVVSVVSL